MSYPNMNPGNPNDPSQPPQPGYGAYAPSQQAQQSQQQDGPQSGGPDAEQTLAIPAIHMATPTVIRMDIRTVIRMVTTRIAIATTVASGSR